MSDRRGKVTVLAQGHVEEARGGARGAVGAEAQVLGLLVNVGDHVEGRGEAVGLDVVAGFDGLLVPGESTVE